MADDNQEVTSQSGCSRLLNSILCAICFAPVCVIIFTGVLGWNEQRAVCDAKAIDEGKDMVFEVGCDSSSAGAGELVMFSCPLSQTGLTPLGAPNSDFSSVLNIVGTGLSTSVEMYQCVEHVSSSTQKDSVGGGTTTVKTYTYSKEWRSSSVNSGAFSKKSSNDFQTNCNAENPTWPSALPTAGTQYVSSVDVGAFTVGSDYVSSVPLDTAVFASSTPSGWSLSSNSYESNTWQISSTGAAAGIGQVRVSFLSNNWNEPTATVLGENSGGVVSRWVASDSWLCSGFTLAELRMGSITKDSLFAALEAESSALTMILRIVGFLAIWFALSRCIGPLEVVADCVPCIGPCLGDSIAMIGCCITCPPAAGCALGVIGIVWVMMRPLVGIPLMVIFFLTVGGFIGYAVWAKSKKNKDKGSDPAVDIEEAVKEEAAEAEA